jgi:hypothetical protein
MPIGGPVPVPIDTEAHDAHEMREKALDTPMLGQQFVEVRIIRWPGQAPYTLHFLARMLGIQLKQVRSHKAFILFLLFVW